MVKLLEHQSKAVLKKEGLEVPKSVLVSNIDEIKEKIADLKFPVVLKAQILATGRLKLGAIRFAESMQEAESEAAELLGREFAGFKVDKILVEEKVHGDELYLSIFVNDSFRVKAPELIFSFEGGVDIESIAKESPEKIFRVKVDYLSPDRAFKELERKINESKFVERIDIIDFIKKAYNVFVKYDARILEINPVFFSDGKLVAGDCKLTLDDSSVFRHPEFSFDVPRDMHRPPTELERIAWKIEENDYRGTAYFIQLNEFEKIKEKSGGFIAFHGIGGGASMLAADALMRKGLVLANYADSSGNPPASKIYRLIRVIMAQEGIEAYVMMGAVFASQEQWHHAHALVKAFKELEAENPEKMRNFPVVVLLAGNKEKESHEILRREFAKMNYSFKLFGREYIYNPEIIADRVVELIKAYRRSENG